MLLFRAAALYAALTCWRPGEAHSCYVLWELCSCIARLLKSYDNVIASREVAA